MAFEYRLVKTLPRLAWCAEIANGAPTVRVYHGPWVETRPTWFCEGAWSGAFDDGDFVDCPIFCGSGGRIDGDGCTFATPTHTLEKLNIIRNGDRVIVSNSLPFALHQAGDELDARYLNYAWDVDSIIDGFIKCRKRIPTASGNHVRFVYHANIRVGADLSITESPKPAPEKPESFDQYKALLLDGMRGVNDNANAPSRSQKYEPLATISTGYDSPACAALAAEAGCEQAMTFTVARRDFDDSGVDIGKALGLDTHGFDRTVYMQRDDLVEAEFIACGAAGQDVVLSVIEDLLPNRVLVTGFHGDKVWDRLLAHQTPYIKRGDPSGISIAEFRLRVGFITLPVPFLGCVHHPAIHEISSSPAMTTWSVSNDYDRPIPRRLAEEAGVPRELFGQEKKAVTQWMWDNKQMSKTAFDAFTAFQQSRWVPLSRWQRIKGRAMQAGYRINHALNRWTVDTWTEWSRTHALKPFRDDRHRRLPGRTLLLIHWGNHVVQQRYAQAMAQPAGAVGSESDRTAATTESPVSVS